MLESYFLFKQMTKCHNKSKRNPISAGKGCVMRNHSSLIPDMSSSFKGPRGETGNGRQDGSEREQGQGWRGYSRVDWWVRGASVRETLGKKRGPRVTPAPFSEKRGPAKGRQRRPSLLLAATMWSSLASSLFLHRAFVSDANSGSGPNLPGQALHPNWQGARKERGGVAPMGLGARLWLWEEGVGMSHKMPVSFKPLMSRLCPPWESSGGTKAPLSLPTHHLPSTVSLFSGWMKLSEAAAHCGGIIDGDYPNFMLPSHCEEVPWVLVLRAEAMQQRPRGVVVATLCGPERKGWREKRKLAATHAAYKHTVSTHGPYKGGVWLEILAVKESLTSSLNFYLTEEDQISLRGFFFNPAEPWTNLDCTTRPFIQYIF